MAKFSFDRMPQLQLLSSSDIEQIHQSALEHLENVGVLFDHEEGLKILQNTGCTVDFEAKTAKFPPALVKKAIESAPEQFNLYGRNGDLIIELGRGQTYFAPGPGCPSILADSGIETRRGSYKDLVLSTKVADVLPKISLNSTTIAPDDIPVEIRDVYALYIALKGSNKPVNGEAWTPGAVPRLYELVTSLYDNPQEFEEKPCMILAACPTPPQKFETPVVQNMIECAKYNIPVYVCPAPVAGVSAPVTLAGAILAHTIEALAGITFMQIMREGARVFYAGAPAVFDMRTSYASLTTLETSMIVNGYSQMGKYYGIPTLAFIGESDSKVIDYQAGYETAMSSMIASLSATDLVLGAGGLDSLITTSIDKLVIDGEMLNFPLRLQRGISVNEDTLAKDLIAKVNHEGVFITQKHTAKWFKKDVSIINTILDRQNYNSWKMGGSVGIVNRAKDKLQDIIELPGNDLSPERLAKLNTKMVEIAQKLNVTVPLD